MTLANAVLFPDAVMPLYIFEKRYRRMLADAVATNRLFAIAKLDDTPELDTALAEEECPCEFVTIGIIRLSSLNKDGTSNVLLQGIERALINRIVQEKPYRAIEITPVPSESVDEGIDLNIFKSRLNALIATKEELGSSYPIDVKTALAETENLDTLSNLASFSLCEDPILRQCLLETTNPLDRFKNLTEYLKRDVAMLQLKKNLETDFPGGDTAAN